MSAVAKIAPISNFAFDSQRRVLSSRSKSDKSITLCPLSISTACAMALRGAPLGTPTREGFIKALQLRGILNHSSTDAAYFNLRQLLQDKDLGVELAIANLLLTREDLRFKPDYLAAVQRAFQAELRAVNFGLKKTVDDANEWVRKNTNQKIDSIADSFPADAVAVIGNCVYFKGDWKTAFDKALTKLDAFHLLDGSQKSHPLMYREQELPHGQFNGYQMVTLPFGKSERVVMAVLLPDENSSLDELAARLTGDKFWSAFDELEPTDGELWLPRTEAKYERELNDVLIAQGMGQAFTPGAADFTDMIDGDVHISKVVHKTYIRVDEVGAEAAGLTGVTVECLSVSFKQPFKMKVNRPYMKVIADPVTRTVLFTSAVFEPEDVK